MYDCCDHLLCDCLCGASSRPPSHCRHTALFARPRCFFQVNNRCQLKACSPFVTSRLFALQHLMHFTRSCLQSMHRCSGKIAALSSGAFLLHHMQRSVCFASAGDAVGCGVFFATHAMQKRSIPNATISSHTRLIDECGNSFRGFSTSSPARSEQPRQYSGITSGQCCL